MQPAFCFLWMSTWIVTGGIGTGKTSVCQSLRTGAGGKLAWFSADQAVHQAYEQAEVQRQLATALGWVEERVVEAAAFRARVREAVLKDAPRRAAIESVLHPLVWKAYLAASEAAKQADKVLVAEIPLYYETGAVVSAEKVIVVAASRRRSDRPIGTITSGANRPMPIWVARQPSVVRKCSMISGQTAPDR